MMMVFTCNTQQDFDKFKKALETSRFYADSVNYLLKTLYFHYIDTQKEEKLITGLEKLINKNHINGNFQKED